MLPDAIYTGWVRHRRFQPKAHHFRYPLAMVQLDLSRLSEHFEKSRWWSLERFNLIGFKRSDYLQEPGDNLEQAVRDFVERETGQCPRGAIQIYTQPRFWGFGFNPVTFYWCHDELGHLETIVAEINNTPWDERHAYVLPVQSQQKNQSKSLSFDFDKSFHVSPFMPMSLSYRWNFSLDEQRTSIHMTLFKEGQRQFDATFVARPQSLNARNMWRLPLRYPAQCLRVVIAIYWQALRLWLKGIPFYSHPSSQALKKRQGRTP
ncbi:plasmid partition ParA protein [gamma proteobacterium HTCC5015]|nr:plasmid partition ParA protein [gamma proteobacterium HTCC5015]